MMLDSLLERHSVVERTLNLIDAKLLEATRLLAHSPDDGPFISSDGPFNSSRSHIFRSIHPSRTTPSSTTTSLDGGEWDQAGFESLRESLGAVTGLLRCLAADARAVSATPSIDVYA
jgi:hypothetical protein